MRKIERREDHRLAVLRELDGSGLTMAEFCRRRDLPYGTVAAWRSMSRRKPVRFVEVEATDHSHGPPAKPGDRGHVTSSLCAELVLPGGAVLRIYQNTGAGGAA